MKRTTGVALAALLALLAALAFTAGGTTPVASAAGPNPWLDQAGMLNMAHQGGEIEAPSSTMYAFRSALEDRGADSLEMDVNLTLDNELVVIHDDTTNRTTNENWKVSEHTLAEIQALDAAYWFTGTEEEFQQKGLDQSAYPLRGIRTGDQQPPAGYSADDFRIPQLEEVLDTFGDVPLNIEIKPDKTKPEAAVKLAEVLTRPEYAGLRVIVASFHDDQLVKFHEEAPGIDVSAGAAGFLKFVADEPVVPEPVALQPFNSFPNLGPITADANSQGYAVQVWTLGFAQESEEVYRDLLDYGVQGIMTSAPTRLHRFLCDEGVRRPDGSARCDEQHLADLKAKRKRLVKKRNQQQKKVKRLQKQKQQAAKKCRKARKQGRRNAKKLCKKPKQVQKQVKKTRNQIKQTGRQLARVNRQIQEAKQE